MRSAAAKKTIKNNQTTTDDRRHIMRASWNILKSDLMNDVWNYHTVIRDAKTDEVRFDWQCLLEDNRFQ